MKLEMVFLLLGGLGLFLYGMKMMSDGLEHAAGDRMRRTLEVLTENRFAGLAVGTGVTAVIQSSSATTVMVVGFVNAGLMTLLQATGVIMGANIGTTVTAQLIAFNLSDAAPIILFAGMLMTVLLKKRILTRIGLIILGFGILFVGLGLMSDAMKPLQNDEAFKNFLVNFKNPVVGVLIGAVFTAVIQSSSASVGILQTLAAAGLIGLDSAVFVVLGQNIGTCATALLASIGTGTNSKRTAGIHLMFNIIGTVIFLVLLGIFPGIVDWVVSFTGSNVRRQIANFHTLFNVTVTILLFPFANMMVSLISKILPEKYDPHKAERKLMFIQEKISHNPTLIVPMTLKEIVRLAKISSGNFKLALEAFFENNEKKRETVLETENTVDFLSNEISKRIIEYSGYKLAENDIKVLGSLHHVIIDLERISDHAENIVKYGAVLADKRMQMTSFGEEELKSMAEKVTETLDEGLRIFERRSVRDLEPFDKLEKEVTELHDAYINNHIQRLQEKTCDPQTGVIFTNMISDLERVADRAENIAYSITK
ncbi:MAG: transcriptional regulator PhoU [Firmicutes bacterium ADurb.Bin182]|nr:MAG: transcriptional regulator PhoU [Firmicutes bacterium ADurb.Bin182]